MTNGEQKVFLRGVAAVTIMGVAIGLILALFITMGGMRGDDRQAAAMFSYVSK